MSDDELTELHANCPVCHGGRVVWAGVTRTQPGVAVVCRWMGQNTDEALDKARADEAVRQWRVRTIDNTAGSVVELAARLARQGWRP